MDSVKGTSPVSIEAALQAAIRNSKPVTPTVMDGIATYTIVSSGMEIGGIAGLHNFFVTITVSAQ